MRSNKKPERCKPLLTKSDVSRATIMIIMNVGPFAPIMKIRASKMDRKDFNALFRITRKYSKK